MRDIYSWQGVGNDGLNSVVQDFAEDAHDEIRVLESIIRVLMEYPTHPIVTWSGLSADFPQLQKAWDRHNLSELALDDLRARHVDLFQRVVRSIRLPIPDLGLKPVSDYFNFKRKTDGVGSGLDALMMYMSYLSSKDQELKANLISYNEDDLEGTLFIWKRLWECCSGYHDSSAENVFKSG